MTPARKAQGFKKTADRFIKAIENAIDDQDYRGQVNAELITNLNEKLQQLERLVTSS
jgi:predicted membrane chloride channel (bestrophin family)